MELQDGRYWMKKTSEGKKSLVEIVYSEGWNFQWIYDVSDKGRIEYPFMDLPKALRYGWSFEKVVE